MGCRSRPCSLRWAAAIHGARGASRRRGRTRLGSGGGIDVLLSARRVGPTGFAYGLDMTDSMLALARKNAAEAGVLNVAFLEGDIAAIPLPATA